MNLTVCRALSHPETLRVQYYIGNPSAVKGNRTVRKKDEPTAPKCLGSSMRNRTGKETLSIAGADPVRVEPAVGVVRFTETASLEVDESFTEGNNLAWRVKRVGRGPIASRGDI